jgi:phage terminase large subunit-like protein
MPPTWTTACPDWETRIIERKSLIPSAPLFPDQALLALRVMDQLRIVDQPGSPTWGELSRPWLRDFVSNIFGAYDAESGRRLIREWFLLISKKNSKSTTAGLIMLTFLILNWRQAGEFGILAPTVEVANNAFKPAADAVKADAELSELFHVQDHIRTITHRVTKATLQVVAADSDTVAGKKWIVTLIDETWLFGKKVNAEDMLREATGGLLSRPEGCVIYLSTQSNDPPAGVFKQKLQYARGVRDGRIVDPQFCPVLYEFPDKMLAKKAYLEPANFYVTNPNMGASVDEPTLIRLLAQAQESGEESVRGFLAKHVNVEIGLNLRSDRWAGADFWEQAAIVLTFKELLRRSEVITAGIDGGGLDDLLGLVLLGRERETRKWLVWAKAWAHEIVLTRRMEIAPRLRDFEKAGDLTIVKRPGQDIIEVANILCEVRDEGLLPEKNAIGVDRHGIGALISELESPGRDFKADQIQGIPQGYQLMGAIKDTERMLAGGDMLHAQSEMMNWCVGNARVEPKGNAILITKSMSGTAKIDPLMALFDAAALMALNPEGLGASFWENDWKAT